MTEDKMGGKSNMHRDVRNQ